MAGLQPSAAASHGAVQSPHEHDADHRLESAGGKIFGAGDEISGGVVDENVERAATPDRVDHAVDGIEIAHVAGKSVDRSLG